jgi:uncharacterized damage-inducible protein DinB
MKPPTTAACLASEFEMPYPDLLRYQIEYTAWADKRVFAAAVELTSAELDHDFKTSENSIRATLAHIYRAERMWLSRIKPPVVVDFRVEGDDDMQALASNWPCVSENWIAWSHTLTEQSAQAEIHYQDLKKNPWSQPLWQIILHAANHSTHHRGQVSGFIRALGHTPPGTDSITFAREQNS